MSPQYHGKLSRRKFIHGTTLAAGAAFGFTANLLSSSAAFAENDRINTILKQAKHLQSLKTVIVAQYGKIIAQQAFNGHSITAPTNIKSASKSIISALIGIAIDRGELKGVEQKVVDILQDQLPKNADSKLKTITVGNLLSMQAGLRPTSGANYGRWVASNNWVRSALDQPFADDPGGRMLYSTGSSHLLSAILTQATGKSTLANARAWFAPVDNFAIGDWLQDPQGIYMGGNQMAMSPRSLLAFGEVFRNHGRAQDGTRVVSEDWIKQSWTPRTTSFYTGEDYGYAWFIGDIGGQRVPYAWGYGGQMLYIVPSLELTVVMTSDSSARGTSTGGRGKLHELLAEIIAAVS